MRKFLLLLLLVFSLSVVFSQNNLPPVFDITADTISDQELPIAYYQMLEDRDGKFTMEQVTQSPLSDKFHRRDTILKNVDTLVHTYWFRFRLRNDLNNEITIGLFSPGKQSNLYVLQDTGKPKHFVSGSDIKWSEKDGYKRINAVPVALSPKEEILFYWRMHNDFAGIPKVFSIDLASENILQQEDADYVLGNIKFSFFAGI